jgi:hypothetical protein
MLHAAQSEGNMKLLQRLFISIILFVTAQALAKGQPLRRPVRFSRWHSFSMSKFDQKIDFKGPRLQLRDDDLDSRVVGYISQAGDKFDLFIEVPLGNDEEFDGRFDLPKFNPVVFQQLLRCMTTWNLEEHPLVIRLKQTYSGRDRRHLSQTQKADRIEIKGCFKYTG